jgi:S1-C subfamily serine protease
MLALALLLSQTSLTPQAKTVWATQKDTVWKVEAKYKGEWSHIGTGFMVKHGTRFYAVTAKHVSEATVTEVEGGKFVEKPFEGFRLVLDGKVLTVKFTSMKDQDISAARIGAISPAATIAFSGPEIGDKVYAIGYPANQSKVLSEGICNQFIKFTDSQELIGFSAPIWFGNSGGALFSEKAEVVGVTVSKYRDPAPHLFYAEKCGDAFKKFLQSL